jgi:phosphohistidine phosphatase
MSRQLLLLRHAKSDWETDAATDFDRPLAARGKYDAPRIGAWMRHEGLRPDQVLTSPAKRALQTARAAAKEAGVAKGAISLDGDLYAAALEHLLAALGRCRKKPRTVLMVGHNPGLEDLLRYLGGQTTPTTPDGKLLPTATIARLAMPDDWTQLLPGCGKVLSITRPADLPE